MDKNVIDAQIRWPDVPAAFGWLSLDPRGQWRLHEGGGSGNGGPGDPIANQQITGFMDRNYTHDDQGRWFFQNGPQRVYVRLDAAALILHYDAQNASFVAHTGEQAGAIAAWVLDDQGRLFAQTALGPGMVIDRDLIGVLDAMSVAQQEAGSTAAASKTNGEARTDVLLNALEALTPGDTLTVQHPCSAHPLPLRMMHSGELASALGFFASPAPADT